MDGLFDGLDFAFAIEESAAMIVVKWQAMLANDREFPDVLAAPLEIINHLAMTVRMPQSAEDGPSEEWKQAIAVLISANQTIGVVACKVRYLAAAVDELAITILVEAAKTEAVRRLYMAVYFALEAAARAAANDISKIALHSSTTGLYNKIAYERDIARMVGRRVSADFVFIDMDGLKKINDSQGHQAGDAALRTLSTGLSQQLGESDTAYHVSGDEFIVVSANSEVGSGSAYAERVINSGARNFSYGVARWPDDGENPRDVEKLADARMQEQKQDRKRRGEAPARGE